MKNFIVEGTILDAEKMNDAIMEEHMGYTQRAMEAGMILLSGLKEDMRGGIFLVRAQNRAEVEDYLRDEPFGKNGIQSYRIIEFKVHYRSEKLSEWPR
ncbi:MAG: YciI family protein [Roseburia sp.]